MGFHGKTTIKILNQEKLTHHPSRLSPGYTSSKKISQVFSVNRDHLLFSRLLWFIPPILNLNHKIKSKVLSGPASHLPDCSLICIRPPQTNASFPFIEGTLIPNIGLNFSLSSPKMPKSWNCIQKFYPATEKCNLSAQMTPFNLLPTPRSWPTSSTASISSRLCPQDDPRPLKILAWGKKLNAAKIIYCLFQPKPYYRPLISLF